MNTKLISEYLNTNLIAYIGNKRRLIPLIQKAIKQTGVLKTNKNPKFFDVFAGTGIVSRLAKAMDFEVYSNDWEYYSYIMNKTFIELDKDFLDNSFLRLGGLDKTLTILNGLKDPDKKDRYISDYYCPDNDENPDIKNERLFYTNYNGKKIDAVRSKIDQWSAKKLINKKEEYFLLALLIYEASTRSNTSGVFKGFHNGFGGSNGDALTRILKIIQFKRPSLINGKRSRVFREDAKKICEYFKDKVFDITYLDPPYNQHQYGSNYHLLNTIAYNDKPPVNKSIYINGKKTNKSAIRKDWTKTKSAFCYKKTAINDFREIIKNINSRYILVSYSTDGIIPFDGLLDILSNKGKVDIALSEYVKFRGGKQALTTEIKNIEFVLIIDTKKRGSSNDIIKIKKTLIVDKLKLYIKKTINPIRAESISFKRSGSKINNIFKAYADTKISLDIAENKVCNQKNVIDQLSGMSYESLKVIFDDIEYITNLTKEDEIYLTINEIMKYYKSGQNKKASALFRDLPYNLSKFNNKKNYLPGLKSIMNILNMLIQTIDMWKTSGIISQNSYKKLELIIFKKLNFSDYKNNDEDYIKTAENMKKQIASLYDFFINTVENGKMHENKLLKDIKILKLIPMKMQKNINIRKALKIV